MINLKRYSLLVYMLLISLLIVSPVQSATILSENFEGAFPGSWTVGDSNSNDGSDYWDDTSYNAHLGSWSAWSADIGYQTETITVFTEDVEGAFPGDNWLVGDSNANSGEDYWDDLSCKSHWGSWSAWSADIGDQTDCVSYDNDMQAYMVRKYLTDASDWDSATLTYYAWYETESNYDYLQVRVTGNGGTNWYLIGDKLDGSSGWGYHSVSIPSQYLTSQFSIGFYFYSDYSNTYEGAYVDDVTLTATKTTANSQLHRYDDNMDAYMKQTIDLTDYINASVEFWHLMPTIEGSPYDYGQFKVNGAEVERYDTTVTSWTKETIDLSSYVGSTATIEWNFHTDSSVRNEGWYIDDIEVEGVLAGEITVYGYFYYWDDDSASYQPVKYAAVELWDDDLFPLDDDLLKTGSTNSAGYYSLGPVSNWEGFLFGRQDIYVKVKAEASAVNVTDSNNNLYVAKTDPPVDDVPDGSYNMENKAVPDAHDGAYNILNTITQGYQYADIFDTAPSQVRAEWPDTDSDNFSGYSNNVVYIEGPSSSDPDEWDESVILHEYGHFITDNYADLNPPNVDYCHDPWEPPCSHSWTSHEDPETAWIEGWPDFFQSAVRDHFNYSDSDRYVETIWNVTLELPGLEGNPRGDDVEGAVASILWDIYDNNQDNFVNIAGTDTLWEDFNEIWAVSTTYNPPDPAPNNHPWNITQFWDGWFDPAFNYNELQKMNPIFWDRGVDMNNAPTVTSLDQTPTSLYRTQTFKIYAHYSDTETSESSLTSTIEYQRPANDGWNSCTEYWDSGNHRWYCDITTTINDNQLGTWDSRTKVNDSIEESGWTYNYNTVTVSNNNPAVVSLDKSTTSLYRTQSFTIYLHGSDTEDAESELTSTIQYQLPGNPGWNDCTEYWDSGNHRWYCTVTTTTADSQLGTWDISGMFTDTDGGTSAWTTQNDVIIVSNNQPSLSGVPDKNTDEDTTPPDNWIDLYSYASDTEDGDSFMTYAIISETNSSLIDCSIDSNRYVDCGTPAQDQYGYSDITVQVDDSDGGSNTDTFRVTVNSVNDAPVLTGIPDKSTDEDVTPPDNFIDLYTNASDIEDTDAQLTFSIDSQSNSSLISCTVVSDRYVDCGTPAQNQYGYSDVTVKVTDTGSLTDTDTFRMTVNPVNDPPNVTLVNPQNNNVSTTGNILFNCSATDDNNLANITLYHNISGIWSSNETKTLTGTVDYETFAINNIPNGNYIWNCLAYDNVSQSDWGNSNFTVTVNITTLLDQNKFFIKDNTGNNIAWFGDAGNIVLKGPLEQSSNFQRTSNFAFVIRNNANDVLIIENNGSMYIDGTLQENQATINSDINRNDFRIKNNGTLMINVNETGYVFLKGTLTENGNP
ncbi:hypothetical protein J4458_00660 [Candidatus Woesearchaeota archaeon]|nr:hypothetical protein [Candidatus Woesearchaeota archaeon]